MNQISSAAPAIHEALQINAAEITTLVGELVEIEGVIRNNSERAILISGKLTGGIESSGPVIIAAGAEVSGFVKAKSLQLAGKIIRRSDTDLIQVSGTMVVTKTGHMGCDVECGGVLMELGATPDGVIRLVKTAAPSQTTSATPRVTDVSRPFYPFQPASPLDLSALKHEPVEFVGAGDDDGAATRALA